MQKRVITLALPEKLWTILQQSDLPLEGAIAKALENQLRRPVAAVEPAQNLDDLADGLRPDFDNAKSWPELQGRMKLSGYLLRQGRGGLVLCDAQTRQRVCSLAQLGQTEGHLAHRFGRPFPTALRRWDTDRQLDNGQAVDVTELRLKQSARSASR